MRSVDQPDPGLTGGFGSPIRPEPTKPAPAPTPEGKNFVRHPDGTLGTALPPPPPAPVETFWMRRRDLLPRDPRTGAYEQGTAALTDAATQLVNEVAIGIESGTPYVEWGGWRFIACDQNKPVLTIEPGGRADWSNAIPVCRATPEPVGKEEGLSEGIAVYQDNAEEAADRIAAYANGYRDGYEAAMRNRPSLADQRQQQAADWLKLREIPSARPRDGDISAAGNVYDSTLGAWRPASQWKPMGERNMEPLSDSPTRGLHWGLPDYGDKPDGD